MKGIGNRRRADLSIQIHTSVHQANVDQVDAIVIATPAPAAARLLRPVAELACRAAGQYRLCINGSDDAGIPRK